MIKKEINEVLKNALKNGADFAELFWEHKETTMISCEDNRIERVKTGLDEGAGVRVISGESTSYAYTNEVSFERLLQIAEVAGKAVKMQDIAVDKDISFMTPPAPDADFSIIKDPSQTSISEKSAQVLAANNAARGVDSRIRQVSVNYGDVKQKVTIANSEGIFVEDTRIRTRISVNAVAAEEGLLQTGFFSAGGTMGFELMDENSPEEIGEKAAGRAILMLGAKPAPSGRMPVVLAGKAGGTMVHEACGHGLEGDLVQKKISVYAGKQGKQVASSLVSVIDDGLYAKKFGTIRYDDEGCPTQKTVLIKDGFLEGYMYDHITSRRQGEDPTGNGRRESYQHRPIPRMRNTYIKPGKTDPDTIVRGVKEGLLVTAMGGGQVNTTTGDYVFDVAEAYIIKDGKVAYPVRGATLTGNGPETLQMVEMVGSDLGFTIGVCGKEGQGVPVSDAQPTMKIKELIVGGTGGSFREQGKIRRL